ncbi:MAG: hypothetical protein MMC23_004892 [Stictis urceolatum]|nr:hypothetical protein [Stictis urceolata]
MAAAFARRLREETQCETLDSFLSALRSVQRTSHRPTLVPAIDNIIDRTLRPPDPRARDALQDGSRSPLLPVVDEQPPVQRATSSLSKQYDRPLAIELISRHPKAGRTQLAYLITANALIGSSSDGSNGNAIVWIDIDNRLNILRLYTILLTLLRTRRQATAKAKAEAEAAAEASTQAQAQAREADAPHDSPKPQLSNASTSAHPQPSPPPPPNSPETNNITDSDHALAKFLLAHLHVFRPSSFSFLLSTLHSLPDLMLDTKSHISGGRVLSHLILSGTASFHWAERSRLEGLRVGGSEATGAPMSAEAAAQGSGGQGLGVEGALKAQGSGASGADTGKATAGTAVGSGTGTGTGVRGQSIGDRYLSLLASVRDVQKRLCCTVVSTRWIGLGAPRVPRAWEEWVDVVAMLEREAKRRLPRAVSVREALELEGRGEIQGRGEGVAEGSIAERSGKEKRESKFRGVVVVEGRERGEFEMRIGEDMIMVKDLEGDQAQRSI